MDWKWTPVHCLSCLKATCKDGECPHVNEPNLNLDVYYLIQYTPLLEFWCVFNKIVHLSSIDANGFITLDMAEAYMRGCEINFMSHYEFWECARYCLNRLNHKIYLDRKRKSKG